MKKLTMKLRAFGIVSKEKKSVGYENDKYIVLTDDGYELSDEEFSELSLKRNEFDWGESYKVFDKKTGKCLNDLYSDMFGSTTYIDPIE